MKSNGRSGLIATGLACGLILLFCFQNCAPMLPLEGQAAVLASTRPTATPGPIGTPNPGSGGYNLNPIDGICSDDSVAEPMAVRYTNSNLGSVLAFSTTDKKKAAFWKLSGGNILHGVVCWIDGLNAEDKAWTLAAVGDFNGDLNSDILWRNTANNQVAVWILNGANRVQAGILRSGAAPITMDSSWNIEGVGSLDGDGRQDIVWRNLNGDISVWAMNGLAAPASRSMTNGLSISANFKLIGLGDFDGNFRSDFLFRDGSTNKVWMTSSDGTSVTETEIATPINLGVTVKALGDFNGDSRADLVLQNDSTGAIEVRYMNGMAQLVTPLQINAPAAGWTMQFAQDVTSDFIADWIWILPGSGDPLVAYTPMAGSPGSTRTLTSVKSGWSVFNYTHL